MTGLRSGLFYAWLVAATLVLGVLGAFVRLFAPERTLWVGIVWAGWLIAGLRVLCGMRVRLLGAEHLRPDEPMLIAMQHQSAYDTLVWMNLLPRVSYVFKSELRRIPIIGPMLIATGQIPVQRGARGKALPGLLREADKAVAARRQIILFPQGTRTPPGVRVKLRSGIAALARHTGLPVVPVATDSGRLWGGRAFRKQPGTVHLVVCAPIPADTDPDEMLARIADAWAESENWLAVDNSVGD